MARKHYKLSSYIRPFTKVVVDRIGKYVGVEQLAKLQEISVSVGLQCSGRCSRYEDHWGVQRN